MGSVFDGHGLVDRLSRDGCVARFQVGRITGVVNLINLAGVNTKIKGWISMSLIILRFTFLVHIPRSSFLGSGRAN